MKKLLLVLLFVPLVSIGQQPKSLETLRSSSEECKSVFVDSVNSFYEEVDRLCTEDYNRKMDAFYDSGYNTYEEYLKNTTEEENEEDDQESFSVIQNVPRFLQCFLVDQNDARACFQEQMNAHIRRNFRYPEIAQEMGIQGRVYSNFIITECGNIENIKLRGPDEILEEETRRIISLIPKLLPGQLEDGTPVSVLFSIPVTFRLN